MTAAQTVADSPTKDAYERASKLEQPIPWGHGNEVEPHLASAVANGYELPAEVLAVVEKGFHLANLHATLVKPSDHRATDVHKLLDGATVDEILTADDEATFARQRWERGISLLIAADSVMAGMCNEAFAPVRDGLIRNELRTAVNQLLVEARKAAAGLKKYAPAFAEADLLAEGNPAELGHWRASRILQAKFDLLLKAWLTTWSAVTGRGKELGYEYAPHRAGRYFCWLEPDSIADEALRFGLDGEILHVASERASEYRLLAPADLMPLIDEIQAGLPPDHMAAWQVVRQGMCRSNA